MKKLLNSIVPLLLLFGIFLVSCKKEKKQINDLQVTADWQINGQAMQNSGTGSLTIANAETKVTYIFKGIPPCRGGVWIFAGAGPGFNFDNTTGTLTFTPPGIGVYRAQIGYQCPDGTTHTATITITVVK